MRDTRRYLAPSQGQGRSGPLGESRIDKLLVVGDFGRGPCLFSAPCIAGPSRVCFLVDVDRVRAYALPLLRLPYSPSQTLGGCLALSTDTHPLK